MIVLVEKLTSGLAEFIMTGYFSGRKMLFTAQNEGIANYFLRLYEKNLYNEHFRVARGG